MPSPSIFHLTPNTLAYSIVIAFMLKISLEIFSLLNILILLEGVSLSIITLSTLSLANEKLFSAFLALTVLTLSACEASLALSLLVATTRSAGNDKLPAITALC